MPPGFIPGTPSCQPLIRPVKAYVNGSRPSFSVVSNMVPSVSQPLYLMVIVSDALTSAPCPSATSQTSRPLSFFFHSLASSLGNSHRLTSGLVSCGGGGKAPTDAAIDTARTSATDRVMADS